MAREDLHIRIEPPDDEELRRTKRPYVRPRMEVVRALQAVVLGGSPAAGDSGAGMYNEKPPGS